MAISFFDFASNPTDNGTLPFQVGNAVYEVTPPASMQTGDLCLMLLGARNANTYYSMVASDGQTWTELVEFRANSLTMQVFMCRFNGTWTTNPGFACASSPSTGKAALTMGCSGSTVTTRNYSGVLLVFRPTATTNSWSVDVAAVTNSVAAPSSPFTISVTGINTIDPNAVAIGIILSQDNNTWGNMTGTWTQIGTQFRNNQSAHQSFVLAYKLMPVAGATGNFSFDQLTLGGDACLTAVLSLKEV